MLTFKKCKIIPHFSLPDLIKLRRIEYPCIIEKMSAKEIIRAMNYADVYEILEDGQEVLLTLKNFDKDNSSNVKPIVPGSEPHDKAPMYANGSINYTGIGEARLYI